jgi:hypothetical protein
MHRMAEPKEKAAPLELIVALAIEKWIFVIRERQVMLDEDLADLCGVETKRLVEPEQEYRPVRPIRGLSQPDLH